MGIFSWTIFDRDFDKESGAGTSPIDDIVEISPKKTTLYSNRENG